VGIPLPNSSRWAPADLSFLLPGDFIGLQAELSGQVPHGVEALTPVRLCVFPRNELWDLYRGFPGLAYDLTAQRARRVDRGREPSFRRPAKRHGANCNAARASLQARAVSGRVMRAVSIFRSISSILPTHWACPLCTRTSRSVAFMLTGFTSCRRIGFASSGSRHYNASPNTTPCLCGDALSSNCLDGKQT
jgi:hypothetical protein